MQEKWNAASRRIQKVALNVPNYTPNEILNAICPIRDLTNTVDKFLIRDAIKYLTDPNFKNSFTEKIIPVEYNYSTRHAATTHHKIQESHKNQRLPK